MKEVCRRIEASTNEHPNFSPGQIPPQKLLSFLKFCRKRGLKLDSDADTIANALFEMKFNK
jgi:hypothetical protein